MSILARWIPPLVIGFMLGSLYPLVAGLCH